MTVCIQKRDRCRICFSLILRDRSTLLSSICCQKYYHLFKRIQRTKIPIKKFNPFKIKISARTVCFQDLILRYLRTEVNPLKSFSNFICYDCSMILLDIEQCAKYLRRTINQLKIKFNKSHRLITSSLSATFQKKNTTKTSIKNQQLPIMDSDNDEEFDEINDEEDSNDERENHTKSMATTNIDSCGQPKSLDFTSPSSSGSGSLLHSQKINSAKRNNNHDDEDDEPEDVDDDEEEEEEQEEDGLITSKSQKFKQKHVTRDSCRNIVPDSDASSTNVFDSTMNLFNEKNPNILQSRFSHMMTNALGASCPTGQNTNNSGNNADSMMNAWANMQRNFLLKLLSDPMVAAQVAANVAPTAHIKPSSTSIPSNNKQIGSGRKRKSTPEKRVITNHRSMNNNNNSDDTSPVIDDRSTNHSVDNINNQEQTVYPLELTLKGQKTSNRVSSSTDIQNLVMNSKKENESSSNVGQFYSNTNEDHKEIPTTNVPSVALSPTFIKRQRLSTSGHFDHHTNADTNLSMVNLPQTTNDLLSPIQHPTKVNNDNHNSNIHQRQQRKLDPRSCSECGKVLFSDKTLLLHCQTHAKNEKQCWICGVYDDAIKKHIVNEHGNLKITNTGFKCQHCDKMFPIFRDFDNHMKEHSKKKPFECPICHKRFGQQGNLSCHLRIHSGVKPFNCTNCGKAFRHSNSLRRHARTVHSVSRSLTTTNSSLLSNTRASLSDDVKVEAYDEVPSALTTLSDDGSSSTGGIPSPSVSNAQVDSDSQEPLGTN